MSALRNFTADALERVLSSGDVVITMHGKERAVMLSLEAFRSLAISLGGDLGVLPVRFRGLLEAMQVPAARKGVRDAFDANPMELGVAAVKVARRRVSYGKSRRR